MQVQICWKQAAFGASRAPPGTRPLYVNLDETSVCFGQPKSQGWLASLPHRPAAKYSRQMLRGCCTLVSLICSDSALQPLLPQYIITNGRWLSAAAIAAVNGLRPPSVVVIRQRSAWNSSAIMCQIIQDLARALADQQVHIVLYMDTAPIHLRPVVLAKAKSEGVHIAIVPAGLTWLVQPLDTHCFSGLKQFLRCRYLEARSASGNVSPETFLRILFTVCTKYLCGKRWGSAFSTLGLSEPAGQSGPADLTKELAKYFPGGKAAIQDVSPPSEAELRAILPRNHQLRIRLWHPRRLRLLSHGVPVL